MTAAVNIITHNLITHSRPVDPRAEQQRKSERNNRKNVELNVKTIIRRNVLVTAGEKCV